MFLQWLRFGPRFFCFVAVLIVCFILFLWVKVDGVLRDTVSLLSRLALGWVLVIRVLVWFPSGAVRLLGYC